MLRCLFGHEYSVDHTASQTHGQVIKLVYKCLRCDSTTITTAYLPPPAPPPLSAEQFIEKYKRNYINYAGLIDVAFTMHKEAEAEYERMSDVDIRKLVEYAKQYAAHA